ncbi:hypothetical protein MLD38_014881 [Melastoma candidum]|uniref:Uncharacterized protein n=1 Tax=Melastoma candidum TaxID=119954 RepID=A0ACB9RE85_9MYRT|nr:hypothetical protein MLD38_014881 [Melastoma candidum]
MMYAGVPRSSPLPVLSLSCLANPARPPPPCVLSLPLLIPLPSPSSSSFSGSHPIASQRARGRHLLAVPSGGGSTLIMERGGMVGGGLMLEKEGSEVGGEVGVEEDGGAEEAVVNAEEAVVNALTKSTELLSYDGLVGSDKSGLDFDEEVKRRRLEAREGLLAHLAQDDLRDEDEFEKKKQREGLKGEITIVASNGSNNHALSGTHTREASCKEE